MGLRRWFSRATSIARDLVEASAPLVDIVVAVGIALLVVALVSGLL